MTSASAISRDSTRRLEFAVLVFACILVTGCWIRTVRTPDPPLRSAAIDVGATTKAEIELLYGPDDTGANLERYFLARHVRDLGSFDYFVAAATPGGMGAASGRLEPPPKVQNLLVEFDNQDLVKEYRTFSDKRLISELIQLVKRGLAKIPPFYQQHEIRVRVFDDRAGRARTYRPAIILLGTESVIAEMKVYKEPLTELPRLANRPKRFTYNKDSEELGQLAGGGNLYSFLKIFSAFQDLERSLELAEDGDKLAQFAVGTVYFHGWGTPIDDAEAVRWFRKAAEQGHTSAQVVLGQMFAQGEGVPQSDAESAKWFRRAGATDETVLDIAPDQVSRISISTHSRRERYPSRTAIDLTLHFGDMTSMGRKATFEILIEDCLTLIDYLLEFHPNWTD